VLVQTGFALLERTIGNAGRAPMLEHASHVLILLLGLWLFIRAVRPHRRDDERSGFALAPAALAFSPQWRHGAVRTLEVAAALAIMAIGGWQMTGWPT